MDLPRAAVVVFLVLSGALAACMDPQEPVGAAPPARGVVAASHPLAAAVGGDVLAAGGNAIDAAAAVQFALNVVEPPMSGIGGGAFIMLWLAEEGRVVVIDGRETAPAASTPDQFLDEAGRPQAHSVATGQGYAVGVPGTLRAFDQALTAYGTIGLADALEPAAALAEDGFPVGPDLARWLRDPATADKLKSWPASAEIYFPGTVCPAAGQPVVGTLAACVYGDALDEGDTFANPDLAATLRRIQSDGPAAFYDGPIGQAIVDTVAQRDGRMTRQDLADYAVVEREPITGAYGPYTVYSMPPPGGGVVVQQILSLVEPFGLGGPGHNSAEALHATVEAMHLAYADRDRYVADPGFVDVPVEGLLSPTYVAERRALIDLNASNPQIEAGDPWAHQGSDGDTPPAPGPTAESGHTTHFVVVDAAGNVASVTTTIESLFGTGMTVPGHGFLLNNELTDFDFTPGGANQVEPGKRPRSSMSPTIVADADRPFLALGSPGGSTIIATVVQALLNDLEHGLALPAVVDAPRVYSASYPGLLWEDGIVPPVLDAMAARGHEPAAGPSVLGDVQAARRGADGLWQPEADHRREGGVAVVPS
jgi:gamma-glutamyltranspeptidase/glutathione hydrolase